MATFPMCDTETAVKLKYVGKIPGMLLQAAKVDQLYPALVKPATHDDALFLRAHVADSANAFAKLQKTKMFGPTRNA